VCSGSVDSVFITQMLDRIDAKYQFEDEGTGQEANPAFEALAEDGLPTASSFDLEPNV
jgi:hypothetical protein